MHTGKIAANHRITGFCKTLEHTRVVFPDNPDIELPIVSLIEDHLETLSTRNSNDDVDGSGASDSDASCADASDASCADASDDNDSAEAGPSRAQAASPRSSHPRRAQAPRVRKILRVSRSLSASADAAGGMANVAGNRVAESRLPRSTVALAPNHSQSLDTLASIAATLPPIFSPLGLLPMIHDVMAVVRGVAEVIHVFSSRGRCAMAEN
jgi:hypothetical protein